MKFAFTLVLLLSSSVASAAEPWTPPENPDPQTILNEAEADAQARNYQTALAKHVWFHENALKYQKSLTGVRLSFALSSWLKLAEDYPPALAKLKEIRDEALRRVAPKESGKISFEAFHDLASINRALGEESITAKAFRELDAQDSDAAPLMFLVSQPALVKAKEYTLCGKYIESDEALRRIVNGYRTMREFEEKQRAGRKPPEYAGKKFINDATTLVALLVVNDRKPEAEVVALEVKKEAGDAAFHAKLAAALEKAMQGAVPKPWP